jgi:hypothetical protein
MRNLGWAIGFSIAIVMAAPASAEPLPKDLAARTEAIPIQTLTISDEQFLKGDSYGKPATIAGVLRVAQGSGRLPLVILIPGSGGFSPAPEDRQGRQDDRVPGHVACL